MESFYSTYACSPSIDLLATTVMANAKHFDNMQLSLHQWLVQQDLWLRFFQPSKIYGSYVLYQYSHCMPWSDILCEHFIVIVCYYSESSDNQMTVDK